MEKSKPTIKDIAELAGVSLPTVHKAIYGKPGISEATRRKILDITEQMHYAVNPTASRLKRGVVNIAAVLPKLPRECDQFFRKMWEGMEHAEKQLAECNGALVYFPCGRTSESQTPIFEEILKRGDIHGVITYCWDDHMLNPWFERLKEQNIPVVTVDCDAVDSCRIACVRASGRQTGRLAAELVSKLSPKQGRVILLSATIKRKLLRDNSEGFRSYMNESCPGLSVLTLEDQCGGRPLEGALVQELESHPDVVGIYCNSASNVLAMCRALERTGLGQAITAIASDIFEELEPYLENGTVDATIWQAPEVQAQEAVWLLYNYINGCAPAQEIQYVKLGIVMKNNFRDYLL